MTNYPLLNGETVDLSGLSPRERAFLTDLRAMRKNGAGYFEIERAAVGPGSVALQGRNRVDDRIVTTPLYQAARDIATRAGIDEGLILAPVHQAKAGQLVTGRSMISVTQAANYLGISRAAVHKAIKSGRLQGRFVGNAIVVEQEDCIRFKAERAKPDAPRNPPSGGRVGVSLRKRPSSGTNGAGAVFHAPLAAKAR